MNLNMLGGVLCRNGSTEGEIRDRTVQGKRAIGELGGVIKVRLTMQSKKD